MSFSTSRKYGRSILEPINIPTCPPAHANSSDCVRDSAPTAASSWTSTTHTFVGTSNRLSSSSWPPSKFDQDPADIPRNAKPEKTHSDPDTGDNTGGNAVYRLYGDVKSSVVENPAHGPPPPRLVAKRYLPKQSPDGRQKSTPGLTLLMLPGMSLPKEVFEPMIEAILAEQQYKEFSVAEIWSIDMPMSGETALVNPPGYLYANEKDIARDLMLFATAYVPVKTEQDLPSELIARLPSDDDLQFVRPDIHVVAHSMGAQAAMLIATHAPELFASLTVFDPAIIPAGNVQDKFASIPTEAFCKGIDFQHESRASLMSQLESNKRTRSWDPRIRELFVEYNTIPSAHGGLQLTAHPRLEWALYYYEDGTPTHCYERLHDLRLPLNAIMPGRPFAVPAKMFEEDLAKFPQKTRLTWVPKTTHQLPFERVEECAELVASWLGEMSKTAKAKL